MKVSCTHEQNLAGIPSASAIELVGASLIIFGDDARSLYVLNRARQLTQAVPLPGISPGQGRLPKHEKPDIESAFAYSSAGETHVIALGSGSSGTSRDRGLRVLIDALGTIRIDGLALGALYNNLRQTPEIGPRGVLNIEGAAITDDHAILAQRAAGSSGNYLIRFERAAFINWLGNNTPPPTAKFFPVSLVSVSGVEAGLGTRGGRPAIRSKPRTTYRGPTMNAGSHLWAIGYDKMEQAEVVRDKITSLAWGDGRAAKYLNLTDIAVVVRHPDGSFTFDHKPFPGIANFLACSAVGFLAGLVVAAPLTGATIGALLGGAGTAASAALTGIGDNFIREVEELMKPGTSALFVLDYEGDMDVILSQIRGLGGTVLKTNVDLERAKLIQSTLAANV